MPTSRSRWWNTRPRQCSTAPARTSINARADAKRRRSWLELWTAAFTPCNGSRLRNFDTRARHSELAIHAESLVITHRHNPFLFLPSANEDGEFYLRESVRQDYAEYLTETNRVQLYPETDRIAATARKQASGAGTVPFLMALTRQLYRVMTYAPGATNVAPKPDGRSSQLPV